MHLCLDLGSSHVDFERDCREVVLAATSSEVYASKLYPIIYDIHDLMRTQPNWIVQYAPRETNHAAHNLSRIACSVQGIRFGWKNVLCKL